MTDIKYFIDQQMFSRSFLQLIFKKKIIIKNATEFGNLKSKSHHSVIARENTVKNKVEKRYKILAKKSLI